MIIWSCKNFNDLTNEEVYKILQLRNEIFVVEQNCAYQDCDDKDQHCFHLMGWNKNILVAGSRLLPPGLAFPEPSIGRVCTAKTIRGNGTGRQLMIKSLEHLNKLYGKLSVTIGAQLYLQKFYESLSFNKISDIYLEDGIKHIHMQLNQF